VGTYKIHAYEHSGHQCTSHCPSSKKSWHMAYSASWLSFSYLILSFKCIMRKVQNSFLASNASWGKYRLIESHLTTHHCQCLTLCWIDLPLPKRPQLEASPNCCPNKVSPGYEYSWTVLRTQMILQALQYLQQIKFFTFIMSKIVLLKLWAFHPVFNSIW
jgi:hypothetical protein